MTSQRQAIAGRSTAIATQKAVWDTADALRRKGFVPSAQRVLAHIGGGSLRTIQRHLVSWRARPVSPEELGPRVDIGDEIGKFSTLLALHAAQIRAEAEQAAQAQAKRDFARWQADILARMRVDARDAEKAKKDLSARLAAAKKELDRERILHGTTQGRLEDAQAEYRRLLQRLAEAEVEAERDLPVRKSSRMRKS